MKKTILIVKCELTAYQVQREGDAKQYEIKSRPSYHTA